jgi:hypothetical protein
MQTLEKQKKKYGKYYHMNCQPMKCQFKPSEACNRHDGTDSVQVLNCFKIVTGGRL